MVLYDPFRTIRLGIWEKSIMWEEKIKQVVTMKFESHEFYAMILVRLIEGLLIGMVEEVIFFFVITKPRWKEKIL